ncbi:MAG: 50S ribosomal protein L4 [Desulfovibrionales bacterium]|nr:MAG: 50S ribosomal protein L4 [Desulfovibrionales bacterium]
MAVVDIMNQQRQVVGELTLDPEVFEVEARPEILHLVVRSHLAAKRSGTVGVKTRSTIRGGGKKPWRQKGTGRARAGSNRSPLWRSGAVTHGPTARDYSFKVNKKIQRLAMRMALSARLADQNLTVLEDIQLEEVKTKTFAQFVQLFEMPKVLIVLSEVDNKLALSSRNIPGVSVQTADGVNVYDVLRYPRLMVSAAAVESLQKRLK